MQSVTAQHTEMGMFSTATSAFCLILHEYTTFHC
jgi:hypothetical protein